VQFSGAPVYLPGQEPSQDEIAARVRQYWRPYHEALGAEITRIKARHGRVALWEGHSIRSVVPFLFDGRLPDINLGTSSGASCSPALQQQLTSVLESQSDYSFIVNGRFKGGYITRHYGRPSERIEAVQLELAQLNYMDEDSFVYADHRASNLQRVIRALVEVCLH